MLNHYESVDALVNAIKGTTSILSSLISRKCGFALLFLSLGAIVTKLVLG